MFQDLDATLAALVEAELPVPEVTVSFVGPDDQFPPSGVRLPAVSFFLYDVREQTELRSSGWDTEKRDDGFTVRSRPPVRVLCSYLVTAWPADAAPDPAQDEHLLLGEVLKVLLRHRGIPAEYLRGELVGQEPPVRARVLADNQLQSMGEFWQAMGGRPKASLHYGVTVGLAVFPPVTLSRPPVTHELTVESVAVPAQAAPAAPPGG